MLNVVIWRFFSYFSRNSLRTILKITLTWTMKNYWKIASWTPSIGAKPPRRNLESKARPAQVICRFLQNIPVDITKSDELSKELALLADTVDHLVQGALDLGVQVQLPLGEAAEHPRLWHVLTRVEVVVHVEVLVGVQDAVRLDADRLTTKAPVTDVIGLEAARVAFLLIRVEVTQVLAEVLWA